MEFFTVDPSLSLKGTYLRAHSITVGSALEYDYATNANFYFYIYKFFLGLCSYTPGVGRIITASFGLLFFLFSGIIYNRFRLFFTYEVIIIIFIQIFLSFLMVTNTVCEGQLYAVHD